MVVVIDRTYLTDEEIMPVVVVERHPDSTNCWIISLWVSNDSTGTKRMASECLHGISSW